MRDLGNFWDTKSPDIRLAAWSMQLLRDESLMVATIQFLFGFEDPAEAQTLYRFAIDTMEAYPAVGFNFPLYTLNAVAIPGTPSGSLILMGECQRFGIKNTIPDFSILSSYIAFVLCAGDGIAQFLENSACLCSAGPEYVLFHEYAHHVQFGNELPEFNKSYPETGRYIELLADALGAYYGHHPRGATFQNQRVLDVTEAADGVGDCVFSSPGHHGTPNQRARAVQFATDLIDKNRAKGQILP